MTQPEACLWILLCDGQQRHEESHASARNTGRDGAIGEVRSPERGNVASRVHGEIEQCGGVEGCNRVGV